MHEDEAPQNHLGPGVETVHLVTAHQHLCLQDRFASVTAKLGAQVIQLCPSSQSACCDARALGRHQLGRARCWTYSMDPSCAVFVNNMSLD